MQSTQSMSNSGETTEAQERTLVLVKPDGVQRRLVGTVISRLETRGIKIAALKIIRMDETLARKHYAADEGKAFFKELIDYIISGPIVAAVFEGENTVEAVRKTMGETYPIKSPPGSIRGDFGLNIQRNIVHWSDSKESSQTEINLFFSAEDTVTY